MMGARSADGVSAAADRAESAARRQLYERLNRRCAAMFAAGLVEETRGLLERYGPVKALDSLGYRQARACWTGSLSVEDAIKAAQQGHRNYAKRQMTWFRREPEVHWIEGFGDEAETLRGGAESGAEERCRASPTEAAVVRMQVGPDP